MAKVVQTAERARLRQAVQAAASFGEMPGSIVRRFVGQGAARSTPHRWIAEVTGAAPPADDPGPDDVPADIARPPT